MTTKSVFFDLDGTLTDSSPGIVLSMQHALAALGRDVREERELAGYIGAPLVEAFATLLNTDDEALARKALRLYRERYRREGLFENSVYPGVCDMLDRLKSDGRRLFVVTAKPLVFAEQVISHFGLSPWFEEIFGSELDGTRAEKADLIRYVLAETGLAGGGAVMVGDRRHDIIGARANGVAAAGVLWGYGMPAEIMAARPDIIAQTPDALVDELRRLMRLQAES